MSEFSEKLRASRLMKGLSQADVAKELRISRQAYTMYEAGNRKPDIEMLAQIASLLGVSTDYLLSVDEVKAAAECATVAAHTNTEVTPAVEARIKELVQEAIQKYGGKDVK